MYDVWTRRAVHHGTEDRRPSEHHGHPPPPTTTIDVVVTQDTVGAVHAVSKGPRDGAARDAVGSVTYRDVRRTCVAHCFPDGRTAPPGKHSADFHLTRIAN